MKTEWKMTKEETSQLKQYQQFEQGEKILINQLCIALAEHNKLKCEFWDRLCKAHKIPEEYKRKLIADTITGKVKTTAMVPEFKEE